MQETHDKKKIQCTHNVPLWRVRLTIVAIKTQQFVPLRVAVKNIQPSNAVTETQE
jgi:hypothetical protein